ncbi:PREDICTED: glutamic acid-rich protein-like isoform X1 [Trachymyrmex cornetzi]|uniref:glutamic acid-rich protein-like isoform X1 n=2 Tax=Trachymyrmex cornetzi TaxID=471704 RepID=UPI00084F59B9|nr:PREDICTED: glutamic acid-rich protein-like isoform X1 [Trachymyrmex cornetzi]XP_018373483.1 PREDICTED: glutamic acid-rich protein-like isoform X1 [Trachymyrmex cornetzi]XP_018373484.1 PREDICTED: glutamic acid-rich protein-like isoform X1 [Trachymyrmex cornetzi]XP_018373485.1 PREDICTED: glutamic acid-rich protein-like isoform X1 [Trachymyrmex cornetzi]XP_018373486.1 PREDICTED: glutamic acid-rich protein-like isoform X1 [Trachymyrmex cornetzi]
MLSSKANAALARLKEIEEKYKIKSKEQKWKEDMDSSISSVSMVPLDSSKESPRKITKLKLDIKMPDTRFEGHAEEVKLSSRNEISTPDKVSAKLPKEAAEIDLEDASPLDDKLSRSAGKQESLISDPMTIEESSLIESVLDDSVIPSKSLSRSKTSRRNSFTASGRSSGRLERTKITAKSEGGKEFSKSSEISRGKASSDNSISKRLRLSHGKPNETSRMRLDQKKRFIDVKATRETSKKIDSKRVQDNLKDSESVRDDSVVEESIGTMENGSEIISELSHVEESFMTKIEDSVDVSDDSKHVTNENASVTVSNSSKSLAENGYANDTFEDISSSSIRSQREEMINGKKEVQIGVRSGTKKMDIAEYRSYQDSAEEYRDGFDLTSKSATKVDPKPSYHVSDLESIIGNPDNVSVRSLKLPRSVSSRSKNQRRSYQHREESFREENVSSGDNAIGLTNLSTVSSNKNSLDSSDSLTGDVTKTDEKKNSRMTVRQESNRKEREEASNRARERAVIDVIGLPVANDEDWLESAKSNLSLEKNKERREDVSEGNLDQRIPKKQDVEYVLKKLHKDALVKKHTNSKTMTKASKSSFDNKSASQIQNVLKTRKVREENESCHSSEKHKISNHNSHEHNFKRRKKGTKITNSKSAGNRNSTGSRKEDKALRFDGKQMRGLRKRIVELQLQQEREDLQKYLYELKNLRLESGSTRSYFKPLEFPKIEEFTQPDVDDLESKPTDQFRERVFTIRRWLKDQYILYRDYCTMAQAINAHYVPTTLDDAKKTIRELRKTTIKTR